MGVNANQQHSKDLDAIFIPYMPYARQDRIATVGDPNAIEVFAKLLKRNTNIDVIYTLDIHSEKAAQALVQTGFYLNNITPEFFIEKYLKLIAPNQKVVLVSPDKGAKNKTHNYSKKIDDVVGVIYCEKERDPVSGRLTKARVDSYEIKTVLTKEEVKESKIPLVIVDDICDGGRTFVNVVEALRYDGFQNDVHLWTTHAIYSAGLESLKKKFVSIASTDSFIHGLVDPILHTIPLTSP
jgi:ribose-phosphate pyrophosphokinase